MSAVAPSAADLPPPVLAAPSAARRPALRRFMRHRLAMFGLVAIIVLVVACALGPYLSPTARYHRSASPVPTAIRGPTWLGSDQLGRDLLVRLLLAGRISLTVGFAAMGSARPSGFIGLVAGFYGGWVGTALMRFVDAVLSFPSIFLLLTLAALVSPGVLTITLIVALTAMDGSGTRRGGTGPLAARTRLRDSGGGDRRIRRASHVARAAAQFMAPIVVAATLNVARAILLESYAAIPAMAFSRPRLPGAIC